MPKKQNYCHAEIQFSNGIVIEILHNFKSDEELQSALQNWIVRHPADAQDKDDAEISFSEYVLSKQTEHVALPWGLVKDQYTEEQLKSKKIKR